MSDTNGSAGAIPPAIPAHQPFPMARLSYAIGFGVLAWLVFWVILVLAILQFVMVAVNGHVHDDVKNFSRAMTQYLFELLGFIVFARDERPFPFGAFPKTA